MEDNINIIITILISAFLLFIFPVYMAYEKKDDVSYALAMRYTQDLVDNVRSKGYISKEMYDDYKAKLKITGNSYDIEMTHEYVRFDPITNYYEKNDKGKYILIFTTTQEEKTLYLDSLVKEAKENGLELSEDINNYIEQINKNKGIDKIEDSYKRTIQYYTTNFIESILKSENKLIMARQSETNEINICDDKYGNYCINAYKMNVGDNFNITIKNNNTTLATFIYNMVTANTLDSNTRIYVNYGGDILSTKWYGNIDYSKMKHDNSDVPEWETIFEYSKNELEFDDDSTPIQQIPDDNLNKFSEYILKFYVQTKETTELKEKGNISKNEDKSKFNFAIGNSKNNNEKNTLSVSVGINGISLITSNTKKLELNPTPIYELPIYTYNITIPSTDKLQAENEGYECKDEETEEITCSKKGRRKITDYSSLHINESNGKIKIQLKGKSGVDDFSDEIQVFKDGDINYLSGFEANIKNLKKTSYVGLWSEDPTSSNPKIVYSVDTFNEENIIIYAPKLISNKTVILSYPITIDDYSLVKIHVKQNNNGKYIAKLYLDDNFLADSIEMNEMPSVNVIGESIFGSSSPMKFNGKIQNVEILVKQ